MYWNQFTVNAIYARVVQYVMCKLHNNAIKVQAIYMHNGMFYAHIEESV